MTSDLAIGKFMTTETLLARLLRHVRGAMSSQRLSNPVNNGPR
jgi:hypothetical protein